MKIRTYSDTDLEPLRQITASCFDGVSIDQNMEKLFGEIAGRDWRWRKMRHINADAAANAGGIFVAEVDGEVVGYITTRVDQEAKVVVFRITRCCPSISKRASAWLWPKGRSTF